MKSFFSADRGLLVCASLLFGIVVASQIVPAPESAALSAAMIQDVPANENSQPFVGIERAYEQLRFERPVYLTGAGDGSQRLFVVEQAGIVHTFDQSSEQPQTRVFLDLTDRVSRSNNEEGLIGFAFHPDFRENGFVFCHYSSSRDRDGPKGVAPNIIARYSLAQDKQTVDKASEEVLLKIPQPYPNHNGGAMQFGNDGLLYVSLGDGGHRDDPEGNGQNLSTLLGAILRIDVDHQSDGLPYAIPHDNPFVETKNARPEIFALGLRNVWRFSFDRKTGELWAADVGQDKTEEVNIIAKGGNYGWNRFEANDEYKTETDLAIEQHDRPVAIYGHEWGGSITGGEVYRGRRYPALDGSYFFGDYMTGNLWQTKKVDGHYQTTLVRRTGRSIASFGSDDDGELFLLSFDGGIYRIVPTDEPEDTLENWPQKLSETGLYASTSERELSEGLVRYEVNAPFWSDNAEKSRYFLLPEGGKLGYRETGSWEVPIGTTIVKNFEMPMGRWNRPLETRLIKRTDTGWESATYVWDNRGKDAELMANGKQFELWQRSGVQSWHAPSSSECASCHVEAAGYVLGMNTAQLNRAGKSDEHNQIEMWAKRGLVELPAGFDTAKAAKFCSPDDESCDLETRARVYLDVNCAMCHQPKGPGNANIDLRFATATEQTKLIGMQPGQGNLGIEKAQLIAPGDPDRSLIIERVKTLGAGRMPNIGSNQVDEQAVKLLSDWVKSMQP